MPVRKGGAGKCATCAHPEQSAINAALVSKVSLAKIAAQYGIAETSLRRHRTNHISAGLKGLVGVNAVELPAKERLGQIITTIEQLLRQAQGNTDANGQFTQLPNVGQALAAVRELRETTKLLAQITGELDERPTTVINVLQTSAWRETTVKLFKALVPYPDARIAVSKALEGQYRELPAGPDLADSGDEPSTGTGTGDDRADSWPTAPS